MTAPHPDNDTYRTLAQGLVSHNDSRRAYASELLEDEDTDDPLTLHFNPDGKVTLGKEGKGAFVACSVWVPNPNYVEDENDDAD